MGNLDVAELAFSNEIELCFVPRWKGPSHFRAGFCLEHVKKKVKVNRHLGEDTRDLSV